MSESNATKIVDELIKLKESVKGYQTSTETIEGVSTKLDLLINKLQTLADAQLTQVKTIEKLGFAELVENTSSKFNKIKIYFLLIFFLIAILVAYVLTTQIIK